MNALVFLTLRPSEILLDFVDTIKDKYNVYICVDDNKYECNREINIIKFKKRICRDSGYFNLNYMVKEISSWDKALLYFTIINKYDNVWFIEDDVYLDSIDTIKSLDKKYKDEDLISAPIQKCNWFWPHTWQSRGYFTGKPYRGMMCACRLSRNILNDIREFTLVKNSLCFLEILFPTIAIQNQRKIVNPFELETIKYRKRWKFNKIKKGYLYHPIKDHEMQRQLR